MFIIMMETIKRRIIFALRRNKSAANSCLRDNLGQFSRAKSEKRSSLAAVGLFLMVLLVFTSFTSCVYFNTFYNAKKYYKTAERENRSTEEGQFRPQNYQKTIDTAAKIPELYPNSKYVDDALMLMGKSYFRLKQYPKAQRKFEELNANFPASELIEEAKLYLGKSLIENKEFERARDILSELSTVSAKKEIEREAKFALGSLLSVEEKYAQAADVYLKLAESITDKTFRARAYYLAGENLAKKEDWESAAEPFRQASKFKKSPKKQRFDANLKWAICLRKTGKLDEAAAVLQSVLKKQKLYEFFPRAQVELAEVELQLGKVEEAVERFEKIIQAQQRTAESARAHYNLGIIFRDILGGYDKANEHFQLVSTESPASPYADSARTAQNVLSDWRSVTGNIDSLTKAIEKDMKFLAGEVDTIASAGDSLRKSKVLQLFDETGKSPASPDFKKGMDTIVEDESEEAEPPDEQPEAVPDTFILHLPERPPETEPGLQPTGELAPPDSLTAAAGGDSIEEGTAVEEAKVDTAEILRRIEDNSLKIRNLKYQLAEISYFQFNNADTSATILALLADSAEAELASKSLYLLAHIKKMKGDTAAVDSIQRILVDRHSDTAYARSARKRLGMEVKKEDTDLGGQYFRKAESVYLEQNDPETAFGLYALVDSLFPDSPFAPRAIYARAWIAQKEFYRDSLSLALLDTLKARYPSDTLAAIAKKKTTVIETKKKTTTTGQVDTTSSTSGGERVYLPHEVDELPVCKLDSAGITAYIKANKLYPSRALISLDSGIVILSLVVDKYGYAYDVQVVEEEPMGLDFGQAALDVARNLEYTPGKLRGAPAPVRIEQRIRFKP